MRMPSRVQRCTSLSVSSIVIGDGGYWKHRLAVGLDVGGRLAVGDHDDLLGARLTRELRAGEQHRVLHVRAPLEVPAHLGQQLRLHLTGDPSEAHEPEVVARELARDERVQRHRHLLGRQEVVAHRHRQRDVEQQHGRGAGEQLGALDLEVVGREAHRRAGTLPPDRVLHRLARRSGGTGRRTRTACARRSARCPTPDALDLVPAGLVLHAACGTGRRAPAGRAPGRPRASARADPRAAR